MADSKWRHFLGNLRFLFVFRSFSYIFSLETILTSILRYRYIEYNLKYSLPTEIQQGGFKMAAFS